MFVMARKPKSCLLRERAGAEGVMGVLVERGAEKRQFLLFS